MQRHTAHSSGPLLAQNGRFRDRNNSFRCDGISGLIDFVQETIAFGSTHRGRPSSTPEAKLTHDATLRAMFRADCLNAQIACGYLRVTVSGVHCISLWHRDYARLPLKRRSTPILIPAVRRNPLYFRLNIGKYKHREFLIRNDGVACSSHASGISFTNNYNRLATNGVIGAKGRAVMLNWPSG